MLFLTCTASASTYTFVTNSGTFIINNDLNTISFKGTTYKITEAGRLSNGSGPNYFECKSGNTTKLIVLNLPDDNIIEFDYVETFEWKDVALYDKAKLVSGLYRNIETYLKSATKLFSVLLASKRPLITELADKLRFT